MIYPRDKKLPIALKNPKTTDQGLIKSLSPIGFVNLDKSDSGRLEVESVGKAVERRLRDEWEFPSSAFNPSKMELLGIVYNSHLNFDYDAAVLLPIDCNSSELKSTQLSNGGKEGKYVKIDNVDMNESSLKSLLFEFSVKPNENSGHMRGDIALTYARLFGGRQAYQDVLEETLVELVKLE